MNKGIMKSNVHWQMTGWQASWQTSLNTSDWKPKAMLPIHLKMHMLLHNHLHFAWLYGTIKLKLNPSGLWSLKDSKGGSEFLSNPYLVDVFSLHAEEEVPLPQHIPHQWQAIKNLSPESLNKKNIFYYFIKWA